MRIRASIDYLLSAKLESEVMRQFRDDQNVPSFFCSSLPGHARDMHTHFYIGNSDQLTISYGGLNKTPVQYKQGCELPKYRAEQCFAIPWYLEYIFELYCRYIFSWSMLRFGNERYCFVHAIYMSHAKSSDAQAANSSL